METFVTSSEVVENRLSLFEPQLPGRLVATAKSEDQVKGRLFLDIVIGKSSAIFQLFTGENETLLVWGNSLLVLNFGLHVFDGIGRFNFEGDGFTSQSLDKDLHTTAKSED